jgi:hypothetical protein
MWNDSTSYNNSGIELSCKIICLSLKKLLFAITTETLSALMAKTHQNSCGLKQFRDSPEFILSLITTVLILILYIEWPKNAKLNIYESSV